MAKSDVTNSKAEAYREERKKRLAKAAKQSGKGSGKLGGASKVAGKIIAIILVIAIVGAAGWKIIDMTGAIDRASTVMTVSAGDQKAEISAAEFTYFYYSQYSSVLNDIQSNGTDYGFDTTLPLEDQTTVNEDGDTITWADAFRLATVEMIKQQYTIVLEAKAAKYSITDEEKKSIDTTIDSVKSSAAQSSFSLNAYLKRQYGNGMNEDLFRKITETQTIYQSYYQAKYTELSDSPTDDAISAEYKENQKLYNSVDVRYKAIALTTLTGKEGETADQLKKRQEESNATIKKNVSTYYADVKDIASFLAADEKYEAYLAAEAEKKAAEGSDKDSAKKSEFKYDSSANLYTFESFSDLETATSTDAANWAFDTARKAGEVKYFETEKACIYVCCVKPSYAANSVAIRDCLISFNAENESSPTDAEKNAAKKSAQDLYNTWKGAEATEASFAAIVKENSTNTDTAETGGLNSALRHASSTLGEKINDWAFDAARKAGDCAVLEGSDGYHIIYFVSNNTDDLDWKVNVKSNLGNDAVTEYFSGVFEGDKYKVDSSDKLILKLQKACCKTIKNNILNSAASNS